MLIIIVNFILFARGRNGRLRSLPALYQDDDDGNDLSDLGLSTGKKNDDCEEDHRVAEKCATASADVQDEDVFHGDESDAAAKIPTTTGSVAENGYDRAIKDYVDFAESKRASVAKCDEQQQPPSYNRKPLTEAKRRMSAPKIEEKVMLLKTRSQSTKDLNAAVVTAELSKVDIGKRREIFEKICHETKATVEVQQTAIAARQPPPLPACKKKSFEENTCSTTMATIRQQVIEEVPLPESIPLGKLNVFYILSYTPYSTSRTPAYA